MYKNQLQELAQRSCFNLPSYACIREGPDHAPRFRASVNFNGEIFEGPSYCTTLRQAEHAAAEVALNNLSTRGPSRSLAARVLDETGVYKNLLQETAHRAGLKLPVYTTVRSGPGHSPVFTCAVELAGMNFAGEPAKNKKQAEKNAAMAAWSALKQMPNLDSVSQQKREAEGGEDQEQVVVARVLSNFRPKEESRPMRQRDHQQQQQQQRRRVLLSCRDGSPSSPTYNSMRYPHQWRSQGPVSPVSVYQAQQQEKQSSLLPLLPFFQHSFSSSSSAQEFSSSKDNTTTNNNNINDPSTLISSTKSIAVQIRNRPQSSMQETPPPMDEHQKDDKEWIDEWSSSKRKSIVDRELASVSGPMPAYMKVSSSLLQSSPILTPEPKAHHTPNKSWRFSPPPVLRSPIAPAPVRNLPAIPIPRILNSGGFRASGIAPAVHIRSVIPVCAAPPASSPASHKEEQEEEASATASKLNKLQLRKGG